MAHVVVDVPLGYRAGDWQVDEHIASGSWGSVYAAHRVESPSGDGEPPEGTEGALKFIAGGTLSPPQYAELEDAVREEVRFNSQADHPLLIRTYETFVVEDPRAPELHGAVVVAMERAERNLQEAIGDLAPDDAARVVGELCTALAHIHALGWVHGDVKPSNVLLTEDGSVRIADFGLARELEGTHAYAPRLGSSDFLPPEWWSERIGEHGIATRTTVDIWALGVTIHLLLTGGLYPFAGASPRARTAAAQAYADGDSPLRLADELPPAWRDIVRDCLAPDHASRLPHTAESIRARVEAISSGDGARSSPPRRRLRRAALAAAACAMAAAIAFGAITLTDDEPGDAGAALDERATLTVYNAEKKCQRSQDPMCRLGLAGDPYAPYVVSNVVARVRHGDRLAGECFVDGARKVGAEDGRSSNRWYRVDAGADAPEAWLPAVRLAPSARPDLERCG